MHKAVGRLLFKVGKDVTSASNCYNTATDQSTSHLLPFCSLTGATNYLCSGTLVEGANDRAIIATAAHCMFDIDTRSFPTHVMFIPGQDDGSDDFEVSDHDCSNDPYGCFYPTISVISSHYEKSQFSGSFEYDYRFLCCLSTS